jgi:pyruvate kinase
MQRYARIIATLGPSSADEETISRLAQAGMNVARLNFSHSSHADHAERIRMIRAVSQRLNYPVSILQDLQGPKLRVGDIPDGPVILKAGQIVRLASPERAAQLTQTGTLLIPFDVPEFNQAVHPGSRILLDDGHLEMEVVEVGSEQVSARVIMGGPLSSHKGVNLPGASLLIPGFTEKDREDLEFGLRQGVDAVAISFVRSAEDIFIVRQAMRELSPDRADTPIIAKLERPEALQNLDAIFQAADGVMVARGDLGVEMPPAKVPVAQKQIIQSANRERKIVITATQMLDSMISNPRPTRAEASDVANAIFDGTDAVMLSGETASGKYPLESVEMMDAIVREAESHMAEWGRCPEVTNPSTQDDAVSITLASRELAHDRDVAAIAVFTQTGHTAVLMAKARPRVPILGLTPNLRTYQRMGLLWGVIPVVAPYASSVEQLIESVESAASSIPGVEAGKQVVVISGFPVATFRMPNFAMLHTLQGK